MRVLLLQPNCQKRDAQVKLLQSLGADVCAVADPGLALGLAKESAKELVVLSTEPCAAALNLCTRLRESSRAEDEPRILLLGPSEHERNLLDGLAAGADDWVGALTVPVARFQLHFASYTAAAGFSQGALSSSSRAAREARSEPGLAPYLLGLQTRDTGTLWLRATGQRCARIWVRDGSVAQVVLDSPSSGFARHIAFLARHTPSAVNACLDATGPSTPDLSQALVDWGHWERARFRRALCRWNLRALSVLLSAEPEAHFESHSVSWARDLLFKPSELLAWLGVHSKLETPRHSFLGFSPGNDVKVDAS